MIQLSDVTLMRGAKTLFSDASLTIHQGAKVGLTGGNGAGKSSLFSLLLNTLHQDTGECYIPKDWTVAWMAQEVEDLEDSVQEFVLKGDREYFELQSKLLVAEQQHDAQQIAHIHQQLDTIDGYSAPARAATLLFGLGFANEQLTDKVGSFSGGWRVRLNLARALMCRSDLLLLDEPTNHLDLDTLIWLEKWLKAYQGTLVLISHDRDFLDQVVNQIAHIEHQKVTLYGGNYSTFEKTRAEQLALQQAMHEKQQKQIAHMQSFITRFKAKASKAKQAQSRVKMLEKMQQIEAAHVDSQFNFGFKEPEKLPNPLVYMEQVNAGYGEKIILQQIKLNLVPGSQIGLLGRNGAGKSTLIKLLANELKPMSGNYETRQGLEVGYFAQHQLEYLRADESPLQHLQRLYPEQREQEHRNFLGGFGFQGDQATSQVERFSGGEKARLVLALLVMQRPNLLLLDEPTNHLDLEMRRALTFALQDFAGAMVVVSHDRHLLRSVCDDFYLVDSQKVEPYNGTLEDYEAWMLDSGDKSDKPSSSNSAQQKKDQKRLQAEMRQTLSPIKKRLTKAEQTMDKLQSALEEVEQALADNTVYDEENKDKLQQLLTQQRELSSTLEETEMNWLEAQQELEDAEKAYAQS